MRGNIDVAVRDLYSGHHRWLQGWLHRRVDNGADAADLTHDVFVRVLRGRQIDELAEPRAFLTTLARRTLFTFWRRRELERAYLEALAALPAPWAPGADEVCEQLAAIEAIDRQLGGLPTAVRRAFLLHRLEGLTQREIAAEMGVSIATVERYVRQAWLHCWRRRDLLPGDA